MASSDTDDDIIISSALLIASALHQRRQVNVRKRKRSSWTREWIAKRGEFGAYNGLVREIRDTDSASYRNFLRMNDDSFDILLQKVSPLITRQDTRMRRAISPAERLAVTLRYLATGKHCLQLTSLTDDNL